jgi:hypothetical protein
VGKKNNQHDGLYFFFTSSPSVHRKVHTKRKNVCKLLPPLFLLNIYCSAAGLIGARLNQDNLNGRNEIGIEKCIEYLAKFPSGVDILKKYKADNPRYPAFWLLLLFIL